MNRPFSREVTEPFCQVAVVPTDFPERVFTLAEAEEFGDALNNCVVNYKEARRKRNLRFVQPSFLSFFKKNGGILLSCEDETTVRWLKVAVKFVKLTGGCTVRIDDKEALDNRFLVEGRGTHSRFDANNIVQNLERFNNELDVSRWKVVREKLTRSGRIITIEMEGRSVGMLRRRRNRLSLDQAGIHKFNILTISPVGRTRTVRQVEVIEITEEDFAATPSREILDSSDSGGAVVGLNDSTTIEEVSSQSNAGDSVDVDGDAFILSTDLEKFAGLEVEITEEVDARTKQALLGCSSTPTKPTERAVDGFSHGREKAKNNNADSKDDPPVRSDSDRTMKEICNDLSESTLRASLPIEDPALMKILPLNKSLIRKEHHKWSHSRSKGDRSSKK